MAAIKQELMKVTPAAASRWQSREGPRTENRVALKRGQPPPGNDEDLLARRQRRLRDVHHLENVTLERILNADDLLPAAFLTRGAEAVRAVGRIAIAGTGGFGTGFLVADRVLMTNNHVFKNATTATMSTVQFGYEEGADGSVLPKTFKMAPKDLFVTSKALDYSVVAVAGRTPPGATYGVLPLIGAIGKAMVGEWLNIIQHPQGKPKAVAVRENRLVDELDRYLHYLTDTDPGSSGSPVFNDQWEVVALHHSGVPRTNANGDYLTRDGTVWDRDGDPSDIDWIANEGVRVSRLVADLSKKAKSSSGTARKLLDKVLAGSEGS